MNFIRHYLTPERWPILAMLISGGLLCGAWFFQYVLGYPPCQMCYWQRYAHEAIVLISLAALLMPSLTLSQVRTVNALIAIGFFISFGLAFWHVGVEYSWWEGPRTCMASTSGTPEFDPDEFLKSLEGPQKMPACSEPLWHFLGLSMAAWNALISILACLMSVRMVFAPSDRERVDA